MKKFLVVLGLVGSMLSASAQEKSNTERPYRLNLSYFGVYATHPGLKLGIERNFWTHHVEKTRRNGNVKTRYRALFYTGNVGFYHHAGNHSALFLNAELGYVRGRTQRNKVGLLVGAGWMRTFLDGEVYEPNGGEAIAEIRGAGNSYFMPSLAFYLGEDLSEKRGIPIAWHLKPTVLFQLPYNASFNLQPALEMGLTYRL